jgi:glycosyltransferase involved in cell wall biosynthesis
MRVLVAHNLYRSASPSGENALVRAEIELLRSRGVDVIEQLEDSDSVIDGARGLVRSAPGPIYSPGGVRRFRHLLEEHRPDVVHLHNVFPLISPYVVRVAGRAGVPVVQTVHNYRHGCVNGLHLRDGHPCTDCLGRRVPDPAVRHGCYRGSRAQSIPMALGQVVHRETWARKVALYLVLTPFMRDKLVATGVPAERVIIRPSWVPDPGYEAPDGSDVLFVGRLDQAKGVDRLLDAWATGGRTSGRRLVLAGDGPLTGLVAAAAARDDSVVHLGLLDATGVHAAMRRAAYVVVPSRVFEGYPLAVAEAFGTGRPVLTVRGGSVGSVVGELGGWTVEPTTQALASALATIEPQDVRVRSLAARARYESDNTPQRGLGSLLEAYAQVATQALGPRHGRQDAELQDGSS